jgi:hypothetical protein
MEGDDVLGNRTAMGEYISPDGCPLTHLGIFHNLALPTPGPADYDPKIRPSGCEFSIQGVFLMQESL